uniref:Polyhomeotic homolog 1 n=1 Tax=Salarias fasciatus TaxID=181472 RepID=A0A672FVS0_SALFA
MDSSEDQNTGTTNGNPQTSGNSRAPQIAHMSLYERQAVQALQALQRQPNAAQYFQQLMLQQQISSAQLHNLAAVPHSQPVASLILQATVNLSTTSAGGTMTSSRPHGPATSATTTALNQSVLLGGNSAGQGQMFLRVNRTLSTPLGSQLIFMPGGTATATVATVAQTQPQQQQQQQQQQHEVPPATPSAASENDQVQNLALHCASTPKTVAIKSELPDRKDPASFPLGQQQQSFPQTVQKQQVQPQQQQQQIAKPSFTQQSATNTMAVKTANQAAMTVTPAASVAPSSSASPALPLSQLLLSSSAAPVILMPTSSVPTSTQGYPIGSVASKANVNTQTLVVQPLQQTSSNVDKGPIPIQPKTVQGHRLPVQLPPRHPPPILPAPPSNSHAPTGAHNPPHIPVQLVGARQGIPGNAQAVALAQARSSTAQDGSPGGSVGSANNTVVKLPAPSPHRVTHLMSEWTCDTEVIPVFVCFCSLVPPVETAFLSPPTLSLPLPLSRVGDKDKAPLPQAVVKPQVLTHLIEGFVIQEGAEPFPVSAQRRISSLRLLKCEYCGNLAPASQFKGSKRFCSNTCAKRYNVSCSQHFKTSRGRSAAGLAPPPTPAESAARRRGPSRRNSSNTNCNKISSKHLPVKCHSESSRSEEVSSDGEEDDESPSLSPSSSHSCLRADHSAPQSDSSAPGSLPLEGNNFLSATPAQWSVEEVCRFISSLQGCEELAAQFLSQEIDGQALLLLREDHLISTMNIKLGPALKICASINSLRE